jgi:hypothetical protein
VKKKRGANDRCRRNKWSNVIIHGTPSLGPNQRVHQSHLRGRQSQSCERTRPVGRKLM